MIQSVFEANRTVRARGRCFVWYGVMQEEAELEEERYSSRDYSTVQPRRRSIVLCLLIYKAALSWCLGLKCVHKHYTTLA